jgi:hypothetical protein
MKWRDALFNSDVDMTCHAREKGKAVLKVYYYGQKNGVVRKIISKNPIDEQEFYETNEVVD